MTINGWIAFIVIGVFILLAGGTGVFLAENFSIKVASGIIAILLIIGLFCGLRWYYQNTASGLERTITIYTADGQIIAQFSGKIDIEGNDGGYVLFDYEGKRYTYYNCFVESVAEIS